MPKVLLVIADSLRYDLSSPIRGLFSEETLCRVSCEETFTGKNLPTILTGLPPDEHGCDFRNSLTIEDNLLVNSDGVMFTPVFGNPRKGDDFIEIPGDVRYMDRYECEEQRFLDYVRDDGLSHELVIYHSFITHSVWGRRNTSTDAKSDLFSQIRDAPMSERISDYLRGVESLRDRMLRILEHLDRDTTVILLGDHGEALGERGTFGHSNGNSSVRRNPPATEVPLLISEDLKRTFRWDWDLTDVRGIVEHFRDDTREISTDYDVDVTPPEEISEEAEERLRDMGYL